ncbi:MAG: thiazole synthase, partial [Cyanobacteria bacterium P01_E01_bin.34]
QARDPEAMGRAMGQAAEAGRTAHQAGRIPVKAYASASSPTSGLVSGPADPEQPIANA